MNTPVRLKQPTLHFKRAQIGWAQVAVFLRERLHFTRAHLLRSAPILVLLHRSTHGTASGILCLHEFAQCFQLPWMNRPPSPASSYCPATSATPHTVLSAPFIHSYIHAPGPCGVPTPPPALPGPAPPSSLGRSSARFTPIAPSAPAAPPELAAFSAASLKLYVSDSPKELRRAGWPRCGELLPRPLAARAASTARCNQPQMIARTTDASTPPSYA